VRHKNSKNRPKRNGRRKKTIYKQRTPALIEMPGIILLLVLAGMILGIILEMKRKKNKKR
jgi:hypothetical protein